MSSYCRDVCLRHLKTSSTAPWQRYRGIDHKLSKDPYGDIFLNARGIAASLKLSQRVNYWDRVFSVERFVLHLVSNFLPHLPNLGCYLTIMPLRLLDETIRAIVNGGRTASNLAYVPGMSESIKSGRYDGACFFSLGDRDHLADIRLTWRRKVIVRIPVRLFYRQLYPSWDSWMSPSPFFRAEVRLLPLSCGQRLPHLIHFCIYLFQPSRGRPSKQRFWQIWLRYRKGQEVSYASQHVIGDMSLNQAFMYCPLHCWLEGRAVLGLGDW